MAGGDPGLLRPITSHTCRCGLTLLVERASVFWNVVPRCAPLHKKELKAALSTLQAPLTRTRWVEVSLLGGSKEPSKQGLLFVDRSEDRAARVVAACEALLASNGRSPQEVPLQRDKCEAVFSLHMSPP